MGNIYALIEAFKAEWKITLGAGLLSYAVWIVGNVPRAVVFGWIVTYGHGGEIDPMAVAYVAVGAPLFVMWGGAVNRMGALVNSERWQGTLDLDMVTPTPLMIALMGKALAIAAYLTISGLVTFIAVLLVAQASLEISNLPLVVVSLGVAFLGLVVATFAFAPFIVLAGGRGGFWGAIIPFGVVLSGFLHPVSILHPAVQAVARVLPTSWAMDAVLHSIDGGMSTIDIFSNCAIAITVLLVWLSVIWYMFRKVERRIRVTGSVTTSF